MKNQKKDLQNLMELKENQSTGYREWGLTELESLAHEKYSVRTLAIKGKMAKPKRRARQPVRKGAKERASENSMSQLRIRKEEERRSPHAIELEKGQR